MNMDRIFKPPFSLAWSYIVRAEESSNGLETKGTLRL